MALDMFDRAVPGESMTKPLQDDPSTQAPKIDNLYDAFYKVTDTIKDDSSLHGDLMQMIDSGVDLETITNVLTFGSFSKGIFSPDVAMQLNPHLLLWLFSEAHQNGILEEDIKIMNFPTDTSRGTLTPTDISDLMARKNPTKFAKVQTEGANRQLDSFLEELKQGTDEEVGAPPKEEQAGFMSMPSPEPMPEEMENV
jgi:hypothetical protein|tara:strand:+ start:159 stop:749 length:591 start_codon:yes stop_codon:yes gene_type:complete